jgi:hypothetical protein
MLPGLTSAILAGGAGGPVVITQTADAAPTTGGGTLHTFTGLSIGAAAADRVIVFCVTTDTADGDPTACTIDFGSGDTAMTAGTLASSAAGTNDVNARTFRLAVPSGTTATFKVTTADSLGFSGEIRGTVYSVTGGEYSSQGTDVSSDMDATDPLTTGSITIPTGGGFIAVAACSADTVGKTWANATEDIDVDAGGYRHTTATRTTAGTVTVTCTGGTNGERGALAYVIFTSL